MSRISCNVTKDLLASYLDGICSDESRELVEEHLRDCDSCRQFVAQFKEKDMGKSAPLVDHFKKVRRMTIFWIWFVALMSAVLICKRPARFLTADFYFIVMPLLMLTAVCVPVGADKICLPVKRGWVVPVLEAVILGAAYIWEFIVRNWFCGKLPMPYPDVEMGPFIERCNMILAVLFSVLLVTSFIVVRNKRRVFVLSQCLAWWGMNLVLACNVWLYGMNELIMTIAYISTTIAVITAEGAVMTVLMYVICAVREKRIRKDGEEAGEGETTDK